MEEVMHQIGTPDSQPLNDQDLRGYLRSLAALTSLPTASNGESRRHLAESLAETLVRLLPLDFAWVRLAGRDARDPRAVVRSSGGAPREELAEVIGRALSSRLNGGARSAVISTLPELPGAWEGPVQVALIPLETGGETGMLAAISRHPGFPGEEERLLLEIVANQAASMLRRLQAGEAAGQAERDLADLLDDVPVGLHWLGPDGTILRATRVELEFLGYSPEEYVGHSLAEFLVDAESADEIVRRLQAGEVLREYEVRYRCRDGSIRHLLIDAEGKWEDGKLLHARCFTRDVTDHKWAERILSFFSEGEADYTCVVRWDGRDLEIESASEGFSRVTGYDPEGFDSQTAVLALYPEDISTILRDAERLLNGEFISNEARIVRKDGEVRWLRYLAQPMSEPGDLRFLRIRGAAQDITERKLGTERVYEAERRFRQMAESIHEVFWLSDSQRMQIFYCSPAYEEIWGRTCESLYQEPWSLFDSVVPEDRHRFVAALERQSQGEATDVEYRILRPDCSVRWIRDRSFPIRDASGAVYRVAGVADDITDRKRVEQTSRFLADASATLVELSDYRSTLRRIAELAVPEFADWCAVDLLDSEGSVFRLAVVHSDSGRVTRAEELFRRYPPRVSDPFGGAKVLRTGESEWIAELADVHLAGLAHDSEHLRALHELGLKSYLCVPLRTRNGTFGALTFVTAESGRSYGQDDLRAAEDLANRAVVVFENANLLAELQDTDRRKDEFLAMLAHELRNPLAPIRNAAQLVRARIEAVPELERAIGVIDRQVQQMSRLVDDLLDVSRISRGQIVLRRERVELAAIVSAAVEASRPLIEKSGHQLTASLPSEPVYLDADATRLTQMLLNLLNNAAKYTPTGGRIWLTAELAGEHVLLRVRDTGIGIPADMLPRIFDMFTQVDGTLESSQGGLGIGLTLVQRLAELHGGTVEAHSAGPGLGSEFILRLPIAAGGEEHPAYGSKPAAGAGAAPSRRILVVDDNEDAVETMAELLEIQGHSVRKAGDGLEAVRIASVFQPDVILLDIGLPHISGYEAARRIREERGPDVVLIATTGWGQDEDRRRSREAGFDYHLTKPIDLDFLRELLSR